MFKFFARKEDSSEVSRKMNPNYEMKSDKRMGCACVTGTMGISRKAWLPQGKIKEERYGKQIKVKCSSKLNLIDETMNEKKRTGILYKESLSQ